MQLSSDNIIQTIFGAIDEVNCSLSEEEQLEKLPNTILAGDQGTLDSLGLINFIVELEGRIRKDFGLTINLIEALESSQKPMSSIERLAEFIKIQANGANQ